MIMNDRLLMMKGRRVEASEGREGDWEVSGQDQKKEGALKRRRGDRRMVSKRRNEREGFD